MISEYLYTPALRYIFSTEASVIHTNYNPSFVTSCIVSARIMSLCIRTKVVSAEVKFLFGYFAQQAVHALHSDNKKRCALS